MAEGGYDPEDLDPFSFGKEDNPNDFDDTDPLLGRKLPETPVRVTSTSEGGRNYENEGARPKNKTGYIKLSGEDLDESQEMKDEAWKEIKRTNPRVIQDFDVRYDGFGKLQVGLRRGLPKDVVWHNLYDKNGDLNKKLPKTIKKNLGPTNEQIVESIREEKTKERGINR